MPDTHCLRSSLLFVAVPLPAWAEEPILGPTSDLDTILDALNARGQNLKDFTADVVPHTINDRTGEDSAA